MPFHLPDCHDPYSVGATTFVTPVRPSRIYSSARLPNGQPALVLDEVAFTAYYPADMADKPWTLRLGIDWLNRPLNETWRGFIDFASQRFPPWLLWASVYLFAAFIQVPVYRNAPLLRTKQWPLVVFSHGLAGTSTAYSQICSRIAASGRVVLAIEHRDGTAPACITRKWIIDNIRTPRVARYLREEDIIKDHLSDSQYPLRKLQLTFRKDEVYLAHSAFFSLVRKDENLLLETIDGSAIDWDSWWAHENEAKPVQCVENITFAGHSFGGCTTFHIISTEHPEWAAPISITNALIFDPWIDPLALPSPGNSGEDLKSSKEHFERLENIVRSWVTDGRLLTLARARHESFSDYPLLPCIRTKTSLRFMNIIARLSNAFLDNRLNDTLNTELMAEMEIEDVGKQNNRRPRKHINGSPGNIVIDFESGSPEPLVLSFGLYAVISNLFGPPPEDTMPVIVVSKDLKSVQESNNSWDFFRELDDLKRIEEQYHEHVKPKLKPLLNPPAKKMSNYMLDCKQKCPSNTNL
ncbi:platelet-activating factor acetylhydrolase, isoform II-domain-containing protein [Armillaria borealis]|uniref:1-alkyl-2-acetylglycerophosphocholine esterase n=1 Tax=Armillaria borealis TaxID=47425 RepID=A0AA39IUA4_9AGAR|nr:platelet-activating factor acetylhydrolase, isoform II-domain-containing protein [Armillaria borealis]